MIPQERVYQDLRATAEWFRAVEAHPHFPPMADTYYMHEPIPEAGGKLEGLLDFFRPATPIDRQLIRSFVYTLLWGGKPGTRPAFVFSGPDNDPEMGRGVGKSTGPAVLSEELVGGYLEVLASEDVGDFKKRLFSPEGRAKRVCRIDNVKTHRFSWGELEGLLTASEVSGRQLYQGESSRPNTLVWCVTVNGASLSKDLAQRSVVIKLARPVFSATWERDVRGYIRANRGAILADVRSALEGREADLKPKTRWAEWETAVLGATDEPGESQAVITARQNEVDDDNAERDEVAAFFASRVERAGHKDGERVRIPSETAAEWLSKVLGKKIATNWASRHINGLGISQLEHCKSNSWRGWVWSGADCDARSKTTDLGFPAHLHPDRAT
jgi:hypothetical protein